VRVKDAVGRLLADRNWRCRDGELDIVALEGRTVVFVEVKTRSTTLFGDPAESVSEAKASRIRRLAVQWLREHPELRHHGVRFDVVTVVRLAPGGPAVQHLQAAF
jgi:putative endonuclease